MSEIDPDSLPIPELILSLTIAVESLITAVEHCTRSLEHTPERAYLLNNLLPQIRGNTGRLVEILDPEGETTPG